MFFIGLGFIVLALFLFVRLFYLLAKWGYYQWVYKRKIKKQKGYKEFQNELKDLL